MASKQTAYELTQIRVKELASVVEHEYRISYPLQVPALTQSIRELGLIQPLLVSLRNGSYRVVCGHRRLSACRELGYTAITCLLIPDQPPLQLLQLAIYDNLSTRRFNPVEKADVLGKLLNYLPKEKVICDYLPVLGLQPHYKILAKYLAIAKLEEKLKHAIISDVIHEGIAHQLAGWPVPDQLLLADILIDIPLSVSSQQEVISNIWEISRREDMPVSGVLAAGEMLELLNNSSLSSSQKGYHLRHYLMRRRYPDLSLAEGRFKQYLKQLQLPQSARLIPPACFEAATFKLECNFTGIGQLKKQLSSLSETMQNPIWRDILKLGIKHVPKAH